MKKYLIYLMPFLVVGCANPYKYKEEAGYKISYQSTKSPDALAECIRNAWQLQYSALAGGVIQKSGATLSVIAMPDAVDVVPNGKSTTVNFYSFRSEHLDPFQGIEKRKSSIQTCI